MGRCVSMAGLDLSFLQNEKPAKRRKKSTGWQDQIAETRRRTAALQSSRSDIPAPVLMSDIKSFVSPIDGTEITSRSGLRAHEQRHGVKQCGDFKKGELIAKENKRVAETRRLAEPGSIKWL